MGAKKKKKKKKKKKNSDKIEFLISKVFIFLNKIRKSFLNESNKITSTIITNLNRITKSWEIKIEITIFEYNKFFKNLCYQHSNFQINF